MKKKDRIKLLKEEQASAHKVNLELLSKVQELKNNVKQARDIIDSRNEVIQDAVSLLKDLNQDLLGRTQKWIWKEYGSLIRDFVNENSIAEVDFEEPKEEWEPFDADRWTPDRVVKTIDGRDVRVLCVDRNAPYPVVALINVLGKGEAVHHYHRNGKYITEKSHNVDELMMLK